MVAGLEFISTTRYPRLFSVLAAGVPVGKVKEIQNGKLYKSAVVEPYVGSEMPAFLYVVTKEN